jgi:predicted anti-sigma-YlaC factor YlaD
VRCDRFREAASARLDGEPIGLSASVLDHHLASCPDCARWAADATRATRLARLDMTPVPDLAKAISAQIVLPAGRVLRRRHLLRAALFVAGVVQVVLGLPAVTGESIGMAMSAHGAHEAAAWNLAIGVAFVAAASLPRRAAGLIPLLATFMVVLGALSVRDLAAGTVSVSRLATHLAALVGLLLLMALDRAERALPPGWFAAVRGRRDRDEDGPTDLRGVA